ELTLLQGRSYPFMASVLNGAGNTGVSWNALLSGGTFSNGLLTAGSTAGVYQVQATSLADSQASALGSLNVISQPYLETFGFGRSTANTHVGASAVTLLDGTVLVMGGSSILNDSFDPQANAGQGSLTAVGNLAVNRYLHTATLLPNGKVLIAGGYTMVSPYGAVATVEIYDPVTGSCTAGTSMPSSRAYHTATLLRDGRVLLVGGTDSSYNDLASALLYNPTDGTFTPTTGSLTTKRAYHTATLLMDGRVLIAGGTGNYSSLSTTEIFDPATGIFSAGPAMASVRSGHTATLLGDGRIVFAFGGKATVEVMDVATATSTLVGSAQGAITYHSATLMSDGRVALIGGQAGNAMAKWVHVFDPTLNALSLLPNGLVFGRGKHVSCLLPDGRVLVVGGAGDNGNLVFAELMK
ncbi:MAG: kelch repeat-containing protein, partial [Holophaga sp.]